MKKTASFVSFCLIAPFFVASSVAQDWDKQDDLIADSWVTTTAVDHRGNWYAKKTILRQARKIIEQIKQALPAMRLAKDSVLREYEPIEQSIKDLWVSLEIDFGSLQKEVQGLVNKFASQDLGDHLSDYKDDVEKLLSGLKAINDIGISVEEIRVIVEKQAARCDSYDQKSWDNYERISEVLNDILAERLYQEMVSFLDSVQAVQIYFSRDLSSFLQSSNTSLETYSQQVKQFVTTLRNADLLKKPVLLDDENKTKKEKPVSVDVAKENGSVVVPWYIRLWRAVIWPFGVITGWFGSFFSN